ncbi:TolC family protein [Labilithrix luteola]|uniref:TolC family protein n=1 Tax=Labilithrix luteola TaxID=1391654 RepID=UPI0011BA655B|nr:TolC family protein [Labilithrix luteola]
MSNLPSRFATACVAAVLALFAARNARAEVLSPGGAIEEAMGKNPSLRAAVEDVAAARALADSESARYDPTLTLKLGATRTKNPSLATSGGVLVGSNQIYEAEATLSKTLELGTQLSATVGTSASRSASPIFLGSAQTGTQPLVLTLGPGYLFSAKLGVTQPLLRGAGKDVTLAPYRQAVAQQSASQLERDRKASALARDVLVAYWELWYATKAVEVDRLARDTAKAARDDAMARMRTGSLARADVLTFDTQLATKEETLAQTELDRNTRVSDLGRLLGREAGANLEVSEAEPPSTNEVPAEITNRAIANSPEIAVKQASVAVAEVQERSAADAYRPRLDLDAYVQSQGLGNDDVGAGFSQFTGFGVISAHVGLTLELPLTDTRRRNEANRAHAATESARNDLDAARQSVSSDVAVSAQKRDVARRRIDLATQSATFAEDQLAAQKALFTSGSSTALQVIQAQDAVQSASKRLARARADLVQAHLALSHLVGGLLSTVHASAPNTRPNASIAALGKF